MATVDDDFSFKGPLGKFTFYKMKGVNKLVARSKSGPTADQIKNDPAFAGSRKVNAEWKGVVKLSKAIRQGITKIDHLRDYNYPPLLKRVTSNILKANTEGTKGSRSLLLSKYRFLAEGFNLNTARTLESIISSPFQCSINRPALSATIDIPELLPDINFRNPFKLPLYRLIFHLDTVSDFHYDALSANYYPIDAHPNIGNTLYTDWLPFKNAEPATSVTIHAKRMTELGEHTSIIISGGVEFGMPDANGMVEMLQTSGCGKVLKLG